jgi:hypothetical protein
VCSEQSDFFERPLLSVSSVGGANFENFIGGAVEGESNHLI